MCGLQARVLIQKEIRNQSTLLLFLARVSRTVCCLLGPVSKLSANFLSLALITTKDKKARNQDLILISTASLRPQWSGQASMWIPTSWIAIALRPVTPSLLLKDFPGPQLCMYDPKKKHGSRRREEILGCSNTLWSPGPLLFLPALAWCHPQSLWVGWCLSLTDI